MNEDKKSVNTALATLILHLAGSSETARNSTSWDSKQLSMPEIAAKSLIRSRPRWQATWKNCNSNIPGRQWKSRLRADFSEDGNIISACAMNRMHRDLSAEVSGSTSLSHLLAPACRRQFSCPDYLNLDDVLPSTRCWAAGVISSSRVTSKVLPLKKVIPSGCGCNR